MSRQLSGVYDEKGIEIGTGDIIVRGNFKGVVVYHAYEGWYLIPFNIECIEEEYAGKTPYEVYLEGGNAVEFDSLIGYVSGYNGTIIGNVKDVDINQI